jgi:hypothetical protein
MRLLWAYVWTHTTSVHNDRRATGSISLTAPALALWTGSNGTAGPVEEPGPIERSGPIEEPGPIGESSPVISSRRA